MQKFGKVGMSYKDKINKNRIPKHIAIIMDGNGRWAQKSGNLRSIGHQNGVKSVRQTVEACVELGVQYLTLYAFSTENWSRPKMEVDALMNILVNSLTEEKATLIDNEIRLRTIGDTELLPVSCQKALHSVMEETENNTKMTLNLALSYSGRWDIINAIKCISKEVKSGKIDPDTITEDTFKNYLSTKDIPDPELLIRTSGELRISNFLLWQLAYSEIYTTEVLWPDFRKDNLYEAIIDYQNRERRFGKTSAQLKAVSKS